MGFGGASPKPRYSFWCCAGDQEARGDSPFWSVSWLWFQHNLQHYLIFSNDMAFKYCTGLNARLTPNAWNIFGLFFKAAALKNKICVYVYVRSRWELAVVSRAHMILYQGLEKHIWWRSIFTNVSFWRLLLKTIDSKDVPVDLWIRPLRSHRFEWTYKKATYVYARVSILFLQFQTPNLICRQSSAY